MKAMEIGWSTLGLAGCLATVLTAVLAAGPVAGQIAAGPEAEWSQERLVEEILRLRARLAELEGRLTPPGRAELERLWSEGGAASGERRSGGEPDAATPGDTGARELTPPLGPPRSRCRTLIPFDTDADGQVTGRDRFWRYLFVWVDDGDGVVEEPEVEHLMELGIKALAVDLRSFEYRDGFAGDVNMREHLELTPLRGGRGAPGVLLVDATRLPRGAGPTLVGPQGEALGGFQPFRPGLRLLTDDGEVWDLDCP